MTDLNNYIDILYIVSAVLFIVGLKMLGSQATARRGNLISAIGMLVAIVATLLYKGISFEWILIAMAGGAAIGAWVAQAVKMTAMPEMVGLFNGLGGVASLLVGWAEYQKTPESAPFTLFSIFLAVLIGAVTFSGSMIAYAKLSEKMSGKPILYVGQKPLNGLLLLVTVVLGGWFVANPLEAYPVFLVIIGLSLLLGVLLVIPIGGADMPVVISLLNSYSGLAACAAGFVILNKVLIVAGCLVGASGIILTQIMCKAMNRSLSNVLFGGLGASAGKASDKAQGEVKALTAQDAFYILEAARSVIFVPGYGMAVAQAQHVVRELGNLLEGNGAEVKYAIHPVAGRMPGHMNVLLAEADVPYEQLVEMEPANSVMPMVDVAIVIGANDVVNPAARTDEGSPIYGMPIINVDEARTVFVLKRSMASGFAGVENPLFFLDNTRMLFGDAKATVQALVNEFKAG
ncbi:MAG: NAD(P)(+) transhydrogenase (Re/Si-specific) subunit beta [Blastocatellia bacterium]|jgi:NAD(P) transhydrogenase subunit beta